MDEPTRMYTDPNTGARKELKLCRLSLIDPAALHSLGEVAGYGATKYGDNNWTDIVRWTLYALVSAEEYGVTSANLDELSRSSTNPDVQRMLGATDDYGAMLGLDKEWAKRAIAASGNYGEIFAANIGEQTPIGLPRGLNALWTQGGLMYAMPFR